MAVWYIPKKFLCRYPLKLGTRIFAIIMVLGMIIGIIVALVDMLTFTPCKDSNSIKRSAYAFNIITIIYYIFMLVLHIWFLIAIRKDRLVVVMVWVVMNTLWLIQATVLTVIFMCLYFYDVNLFSWIVCFICGILAYIICLYGVLMGYGLYLQIKANQAQSSSSAQAS